MTEGWVVTQRDDGPMHISPINDARKHVFDETCWCKPTEEDGIIVHHSFDQREAYEVQ